MTSDIREELSETIHNAAMGKPEGEAIFATDETECIRLADAILASPLIRRLQAEAWDEGFDKGHYINDQESRDCGCNTNPYREEEA